jgi:hypothetical protein
MVGNVLEVPSRCIAMRLTIDNNRGAVLDDDEGDHLDVQLVVLLQGGGTLV